MKQFLLVLFLLLFSAPIFAQQFSQYNTGTLYDSFENPAQRTFIPDSSKMYAFNFLFPNFNTSFYLSGNAQAAFQSRVFSSYYNTAALQIGQNKYNHINVNANAYSVMFKIFASLDGNQEIGFSINTKAESKGLISDESVAILSGFRNFPYPNNSYSNIFNDNYYYQVYQQIGFTYREQIRKNFALGVKINALSGVSYDKIVINQSRIDFDRPNDAANLYLQGTNYSSGREGKSYAQNLIPAFHNPGLSISIGTSYKTEDGYTIQTNLKDLGFIHWNKTSGIYNFNNFNSPNSAIIHGLTTPYREDSVYQKFAYLVKTKPTISSFNSPTNGLLELSAMKVFWLDYNKLFKFAPTLIASKELFYSGFTAALVTPVQYQNYSLTFTSAYNDLKLFNFGSQFMIKSSNAEFFIGSERLFQTGAFITSALNPVATQIQGLTRPTASTGADFFIGFSMKFGPLIEHPMNASSVPMGQKGPLGQLFDRIFKKDKFK
ncbi:MAG: hypothetical protein JWQ06_334 [Mucilaginibacter sp.]|nr:hypothetical protein [Mucilaginibacter sp.]